MAGAGGGTTNLQNAAGLGMHGAAMRSTEDLERDLITLRDWLRYAVSRFNAAGLAYGHGTATALDEAAFLLLHTLHLAVDQLEPWLDARLSMAERRALHEIIDKRIKTRKPAPYLTNEAFVQGHSFYVDERVIVPRSYIGELLGKGLAGVVDDPDAVERVLDLCTGSGCLAILAALAFPNAQIDASDVSPDALAVAERNVADYGLEDRITLLQSDLFAALSGRRYDSDPGQSALRQCRRGGRFPTRICSRTRACPCRRGGRPRHRAPHTGHGGKAPYRGWRAGGRVGHGPRYPGARLSPSAISVAGYS